ncbi:cytochrome ubiquinol oxidase subunit I [Salinisphaera orenii]|uniref:Cytochrome D ubiquinol oxidase subunit I n=1 Tax=Salinisphaera orenii YIM 95161 TaxID=1051139 RepID=A0A423Q0S5_9GAMM|nr:cytochrome ubiquinol oxidase subunit I [Salinisphaera halophila]ROO31855.1 cytochrome D ubiquinol oxidase subunit I [Salinisphaera halophila YIM 95161]
MSLDPEILSRVQFAFVVSFHILFPAFTIGLASWLAMCEGLYLWTRRDVYRRLYHFWVKIFAVSFGMGVVSGIVMSFQFGTNWSRFAEATAPVLGPLFTYEVLTAFFLEATFLGIMLFGWNKVGPKLHFIATVTVGLGTTLSAFWILSANSWMHTPAGFEIRDGVFYPVDWWKIVFNPSFPYRLVHMVLAAYLTTAFVILAVGAWYRLKGTAHESARVMLTMGVGFVSIVTPLQILAGDLHGLKTLEYQPAKIAAMEAHWETERGAALALFAWPDAEAETNHYEIALPNVASLILTHEWNGELTGLKDFPRDERPPVAPIFFSFRIMVGLGLLMLVAGVTGLWLAFRRRLYDSPRYHRFLVAMAPSGFVAVLAGWITTEIGRQPYTVYGLMRTSDSLSPVAAPSVAATLVTFVVVYGIVFGAGLYYILRIIRTGPERRPDVTQSETPATPARPLAYPDESTSET